MQVIPNRKKRKVQFIALFMLYLTTDMMALISCFSNNEIITALIFGAIITLFAVMHLRSVNLKILNYVEVKNTSLILNYVKGNEIELSPAYGTGLKIGKNKLRAKYRIFLEKTNPTNKNSYVFTDILFDQGEKEYLNLSISKLFIESMIKLSLKDRFVNKIKRLTNASS